MFLKDLIQTYLYFLIPDKLFRYLGSFRDTMVVFLSNTGLAESVMDVVYRVKKNTQMRAEGKNHYYPIIPGYKTIEKININCNLSPYLQYAIATDVKYFGLVVRYAGTFLNSKKMTYRKRMLGLWPHNCGVNYPVCSVKPGIKDARDSDGDGILDNYQLGLGSCVTYCDTWAYPAWYNYEATPNPPGYGSNEFLDDIHLVIKFKTDNISKSLNTENDEVSNPEVFWNTYINLTKISDAAGNDFTIDTTQVDKYNDYSTNPNGPRQDGTQWTNPDSIIQYVFAKGTGDRMSLDLYGLNGNSDPFTTFITNGVQNVYNIDYEFDGQVSNNDAFDKFYRSFGYFNVPRKDKGGNIKNQSGKIIQQWIKKRHCAHAGCSVDGYLQYTDISRTVKGLYSSVFSAWYNPLTAGLNFRPSTNNKIDYEIEKIFKEANDNIFVRADIYEPDGDGWPWMGIMTSSPSYIAPNKNNQNVRNKVYLVVSTDETGKLLHPWKIFDMFPINKVSNNYSDSLPLIKNFNLPPIQYPGIMTKDYTSLITDFFYQSNNVGDSTTSNFITIFEFDPITTNPNIVKDHQLKGKYYTFKITSNTLNP